MGGEGVHQHSSFHDDGDKSWLEKGKLVKKKCSFDTAKGDSFLVTFSVFWLARFSKHT